MEPRRFQLALLEDAGSRVSIFFLRLFFVHVCVLCLFTGHNVSSRVVFSLLSFLQTYSSEHSHIAGIGRF
jgi:hypothetical protein